LYLCHYMASPLHAKVTCRLLAQRSGQNRCLPWAKLCPKASHVPEKSKKMNNRTKHFQLRLTPEEAKTLKEKAASYGSVSHYIRCAVAECSNVNARQRLELINELGAFYRQYRDRLSWAGSNLNQSVKRANELAIAGKLAPYYIDRVLLPVIKETQAAINEIKSALDNVTRKATKL